MPLSTVTATLDSTLGCSIDEFCIQQSTNTTQDSISFTTFLTISSTLLATIYSAASSSLTLSSIKLYSFYNKQRLLNNPELIRSTQLYCQFNSTSDSCDTDHLICSTTNTSPTQSEIVSITGGLIVFTVLLTTVLLTHLFDAIDDFTRKWGKCCRMSSLIDISVHYIGLAKNTPQLIGSIKQLLLDLIITIVLKSTLLTSLFVDAESLKLNNKLNFDEDRDFDDDEQLERVDELLSRNEDEQEVFSEQRKWSTWFAGELRKRLIHS